MDVHSAVVSTSFADGGRRPGARLGWSEDGRVERDAHHAARSTARAVDPAHRDALLRRALAAAAAAGIASVHEHSAPGIDTREGLARLLELTAEPGSGLPHVGAYRGELCADPDEARALLAAVPGLTGIGGDLNVDGSVGSRTAALREPDAERPGRGRRSAVTSDRPSRCRRTCARSGAAGVHAGLPRHRRPRDGRDARRAAARRRRRRAGPVRAAGHRIEHAEMIDATTLAALSLLGVRLSMQPAFDAAWGGGSGMYAARLGAERRRVLNAFARSRPPASRWPSARTRR